MEILLTNVSDVDYIDKNKKIKKIKKQHKNTKTQYRKNTPKHTHIILKDSFKNSSGIAC